MTKQADKHRKPSIVITKTDFDRLWRLAEAYEARDREVAQELMSELDRARVVEDRRIPDGVIRIGSAVRYESDHGVRTVTSSFRGRRTSRAAGFQSLRRSGLRCWALPANR